MADDVTPIRPPEVIAEVGGEMDDVGVTLAIYGEDLDPDAVTARLGCAPTDSFRRGSQKGPRSPPRRQGGWFLEERRSAPFDVDELVTRVLGRVPADEAFWAGMRRDYLVQIRFGFHMSSWNRGFELSPATLQRIAVTGAPALFDVYSCGDEEDA